MTRRVPSSGRTSVTRAMPRFPHPSSVRGQTSLAALHRGLRPRAPPSTPATVRAPLHPAAPATGRRRLSDGLTKSGSDLFAAAAGPGVRRKIVLESYAPSGVDVTGLVRVGGLPEEGLRAGDDVVVHLHGSVAAFPDACFLWDVTAPGDVTLESLAVVALYRPAVEYLFIGCDRPLLPPAMAEIKREFRKKGVVVEAMDVMNAMGTFNILNGEDRRVACVLVIDPDEDSS